MITWDQLTELEPRLNDLRNEIQDAIQGRTLSLFEANRLWYGPPGEEGFKHQMNRLVGFMVDEGDDRLKDSDAHGAAYTKLYFETLLPAVYDIDEDYDPRYKPNKKSPPEMNTRGDERKHSGDLLAIF